MTDHFKSYFQFVFLFTFFSFLGVHYAHMKTPSLSREIASQSPTVVPWYNAGFKI